MVLERPDDSVKNRLNLIVFSSLFDTDARMAAAYLSRTVAK